MPGTESPDRVRPRWPSLVLGAAASLAVPALYAVWIRQPHIRYDDFNFLTRSRTWADAFANLWHPMNDHAMPLPRLAAALLMQLVPGQSDIPLAAQLQGPIAVVIGMWLLFVFVKRELGHAFYGLIAMIGWGVTTAFFEAATSYAASFFLFALDSVLVGLLAAQSWRQHGRTRSLLWCAMCCAVAPAWHGTGLLGGVYCATYLLASTDRATVGSRSRWQLLAAAAPIAGTVIFLSISLPITASRVIHAEHYGGKTAFEAFDARLGMENTLRTIADNQVIGAFGVHKKWPFSWPAALMIDAVLLGAALLWWRGASRRQLLLLGLVLIVANDLLVYSARADWDYERSVHRWTRYHVFPHLGLVLFLIGGLPRFEGRWFRSRAGNRLSPLQVLSLALLLAAALASHLPRSSIRHIYFPEQHEILRRVEDVDALCQKYRISGPVAREAMGFLQFPFAYDGENAWEFLRGSPSPEPVSVEEARRLLSQ